MKTSTNGKDSKESRNPDKGVMNCVLSINEWRLQLLWAVSQLPLIGEVGDKKTDGR